MLRINIIILLTVTIYLKGCDQKSDKGTFNAPQEVELGALYEKNRTIFRVYSPVADQVTLTLYEDGHTDSRRSVHKMVSDQGIWHITLPGDLHKTYYTFQADIDGQTMREVTDPYARAVGLNGNRAMVVDLSQTDPVGWSDDVSPPIQNLTDAIIYEMHIRDFSIQPESGINSKGTYLAFTEDNTDFEGVPTGISHLRELGITHLHLLPAFDFRSIDESGKTGNQYNWGYDPQNYNVPEGSYSSDAHNGEVRIREFKKMVMALHRNGIRVIMDVVYNHTGATEDSNFNQLYPGYYYRMTGNGGFSNASACGNETASEKPMMRKFMIESILYWIREYHIDGFRFDLMGIHDLETMNLIAEEVKKTDPTILLYGEGWTAGDCPLPEAERAIKANALHMPDIAVFSDEIRDGIKGHWADHHDRGFVSQKNGMTESVKFGIVGGTDHPDVDYTKVNYAKSPRTNGPWQTINYVACHDDMTLYDKLKISTNSSEDKLVSMHLLANTIVMTSQGIPFLHAGGDFLRTKDGNSNSYKSPDSINQLDWKRKAKYNSVHQYYRDLIAMRKSHPIFRLPTSDEILKRLDFINSPDNVIAYRLNGDDLPGETWSDVVVIFNGNDTDIAFKLPDGEWKTVLSDHHFYNDQTATGKITISAIDAVILYRSTIKR